MSGDGDDAGSIYATEEELAALRKAGEGEPSPYSFFLVAYRDHGSVMAGFICGAKAVEQVLAHYITPVFPCTAVIELGPEGNFHEISSHRDLQNMFADAARFRADRRALALATEALAQAELEDAERTVDEREAAAEAAAEEEERCRLVGEELERRRAVAKRKPPAVRLAARSEPASKPIAVSLRSIPSEEGFGRAR